MLYTTTEICITYSSVKTIKVALYFGTKMFFFVVQLKLVKCLA